MASDTATIDIVKQAKEIERIFKLQQEHQPDMASRTATQRMELLDALLGAIKKYKYALREALYLDFRKPPAEVDLTEIYTVTTEIKHAKKHLADWMRPQPVPTPLAHIGSRSSIVYEPKGTVLIIASWNYPFNLAFGPLISALAAGNTAIIKPSEFSPHTNKVMQEIVHEVFLEKEVAFFEGAVETAQNLLDLPFDHIFFTGSPGVGKIIMKAASRHLSSVTLELGGKSPVIVDQTVDLENAVKRIAWAKFTNAGQTCLAPDYLFVHQSKLEQFIYLMKHQITEFYTDDAKHSDHFARIVNERNFKRLNRYLDDAVAFHAKVETGGNSVPEQLFMEPTLLTKVDPECKVMQEEIFGPILPIFTFQSISEVIQFVRKRPKPLALYIFSDRQKHIDQIVKGTSSGAVCINTCNVHFNQPNLPFGGVNNSGIGRAHGRTGFETFSNNKSVLTQWAPIAAIDLLTPPYNRFKQKLIDWIIRWL